MARGKKAISFGLVNIPIELNNVINNNDTSFNQLHKKCNNRIKYQKVCESCDTVVNNEDIIRAYEYTKDEYITFTDEDFEELRMDSNQEIEIISFIDLNEIDPVYFEKSYYLSSGKSKAFELFKEVLKKENKVALAKTVLYTKFYYCIIRLEDNILILNTLYFDEEINLEKSKQVKQAFTKQELDLATKLVKSMTGKFQPEKYKDEYQDNIKKAIEQKLNGKAIKKSKVKPKESVSNLMDALKQSLKNK